jgi:hypothetical protein
MGKTLKQIDKDILENIKKIHTFVNRWSMMTKEEHEEGKIDDFHFEQTGRIRMEIETEIRSIYHDVMEQEAIDAHIEKINAQMKKEFG